MATNKTGSYLDIIPVKVKNNGKSICTNALLDSGSEPTLCELRLIDEINLYNSHVKLAIQTLFTDDPYILDVIAVVYVILLHSLNLANFEVVNIIPLTPTIIPNFGDMQRHLHLCDVFLMEVKEVFVILLISKIYAAAHQCLENRFSPTTKARPGVLLTNFGWMLRGTHPVNENDTSTNEDYFAIFSKSFPKCAFFCLQNTAKEFSKDFDRLLLEVVYKNFYVDDCLVSVANEK